MAKKKAAAKKKRAPKRAGIYAKRRAKADCGGSFDVDKGGHKHHKK